MNILHPEPNKEDAECSPALVLRQLARIVASKGFVRSTRLIRFLQLVTKYVLDERATLIKEFLIGVDVYDRGNGFDPRNDPIVRVEARRLRAKLTDFYRKEGRFDLVLIQLAKGSYVPTIRQRAPREAGSFMKKTPDQPRPLISFFVHRLEDNPMVRAAPIAIALSLLYNIEILGFLRTGCEVFKPFREMFRFKVLTVDTDTPTAENYLKLAQQARGALIYVFKPLPETLIPGIIAAKMLSKRPLFVDVDDEHLPAITEVVYPPPIPSREKVLLKTLLQTAEHMTVASSLLQDSYGGDILHSGLASPDTSLPQTDDNITRRKHLGLPVDRKLVMFAGTPRAHKGIDVLLQVISNPAAKDWDLVFLGQPPRVFQRERQNGCDNRVHLLGTRAYTDMPELLSMVDAIVVPQLDTPFGRHQVPVKLLDAMSSGRPIIATSVGDIPRILGYGKRGWVVSPGSADEIVRALLDIQQNQRSTQERTRNALKWFVTNASAKPVCSYLNTLIRKALLPSQYIALPDHLQRQIAQVFLDGLIL